MRHGVATSSAGSQASTCNPHHGGVAGLTARGGRGAAAGRLHSEDRRSAFDSLPSGNRANVPDAVFQVTPSGSDRLSLAGELDFSTANLLAGAASGLPG